MSKIGFVGLGQMGLAMAANLVGAGHDVAAYDVDEARVAAAVSVGAQRADTLAEVGAQREFVITMLPTGQIVHQVLFADDGLASSLEPTALVIDMSTVHPLESDELRHRLQAQGVEMMDAPVGRTSDHAVRGELLILAGGTPDQLTRAEPILRAMGNELVDAGGPGMGIRVKIVNNFMSIALNALSAEALTMAEGLGLDPALTLEVLGGTPAGRGHFSTTWPGKVLAGDLSPAFGLDLAAKDLDIAIAVADEIGLPIPCGTGARAIYEEARVAGRGGQDWTAVLEQTRCTRSPRGEP